MSKFTRSGSYWSRLDRKRHHASSRLLITSLSRPSLKAWLPTKVMRLISVAAFVDLEHHVDAVLAEPDDLGLHRRGVVAAPWHRVEDALPVRLRQRRREHRARAQLQLRRAAARR